MIYSGQKVVVLGLGVSGRAAVRYALSCGAKVGVSDSREVDIFLSEEKDFLSGKDLSWEAGGHSLEYLQKADLVLVSPGVDLELPVLKAVRNEGVKVVGELAVAAGKFPVPIVAVTGTNGKTTVTTLIGEILTGAGKRVFVGGNIGTPLYEYLLNPLKYDVVVAEVSSFQLECAGSFAPDVGVLLNISPDHLDRHGSLEKYIQAKMQLFGNQQKKHLAVVNGDDPLCSNLPSGVQSEVCSFGSGSGNTAVLGDNRLFVSLAGEKEEYEFDAIGRLGRITLENYAAALLAVKALGCTTSQINDGLKAFSPLPHRIEFVAEVSGVAYYNDSKATNTGAVIAALQQFRDRVILIAGGRDKGDDYLLLRESVGARADHVVVLGETAGLLEEALADVVKISRADSMGDAVRQAAEVAKKGDVVLLSPACASFDMFNSYGHRGNEFKREVQALRPIRV
jgi:UDP-N-acetylmuramoylalanine--D-glutamate ligase